MNRRTFLKYLGLAPAAAIIGKEAIASPVMFEGIPSPDSKFKQDFMGFGMAEIKAEGEPTPYPFGYDGPITATEIQLRNKIMAEKFNKTLCKLIDESLNPFKSIG